MKIGITENKEKLVVSISKQNECKSFVVNICEITQQEWHESVLKTRSSSAALQGFKGLAGRVSAPINETYIFFFLQWKKKT